MASGRGVNDGSSRLPRECVKPCHAALTEQQKPLPCCDNIIVRTMIRQAAGTMIRNTVETMIRETVGAPSELQPPVLAGTMICCTVGGCDSQHCRDSDSQHCRDSDSQHFVWTVIRSVVTRGGLFATPQERRCWPRSSDVIGWTRWLLGVFLIIIMAGSATLQGGCPAGHSIILGPAEKKRMFKERKKEEKV